MVRLNMDDLRHHEMLLPGNRLNDGPFGQQLKQLKMRLRAKVYQSHVIYGGQIVRTFPNTFQIQPNTPVQTRHAMHFEQQGC
jgi:hypothetical protein